MLSTSCARALWFSFLLRGGAADRTRRCGKGSGPPGNSRASSIHAHRVSGPRALVHCWTQICRSHMSCLVRRRTIVNKCACIGCGSAMLSWAWWVLRCHHHCFFLGRRACCAGLGRRERGIGPSLIPGRSGTERGAPHHLTSTILGMRSYADTCTQHIAHTHTWAQDTG